MFLESDRAQPLQGMFRCETFNSMRFLSSWWMHSVERALLGRKIVLQTSACRSNFKLMSTACYPHELPYIIVTCKYNLYRETLSQFSLFQVPVNVKTPEIGTIMWSAGEATNANHCEIGDFSAGSDWNVSLWASGRQLSSSWFSAALSWVSHKLQQSWRKDNPLCVRPPLQEETCCCLD